MVADQFYVILHKHCNKVQVVSCDEPFLDVTDSEGEDAQLLASVNRKVVFETAGCIASGGVSGNLLMARLAARTAKPDGQCYIPPEKGTELDESDLSKWFERNQLDINLGRVVVKPTRAGSSIVVTVAYGVVDSLKKANGIISEGIDDKVIVEIFLEGGSEFTAIVLDVGSAFDCLLVALLPTEVKLQCQSSADASEKDAIFNYRRKYLPTQQVAYYTPPRFPMDVTQGIREGASLLFKQLGLRDFARIDGWFLPSVQPLSVSTIGRTDSGAIIFTDTNLISEMEQTNFLFQQASKVHPVPLLEDQNLRYSLEHPLNVMVFTNLLSFLAETLMNV